MENAHHQNLMELENLSPAKRAEVERGLAQLDALLKANPLVQYNNAQLIGEAKVHKKQMLFHSNKERIRAYLGGNRSAKSTGGTVDDIIQAIDADVVPDHLKDFKKWQPPFRCRIVTPDFSETLDVVLEIIQRWCPQSQLRGGQWRTAYDKLRRTLHFQNGSYFQFMSYEQDTNKFGGAELERIHFDEEPPRRIYKECRKRLITTRGDILLTMTPETGFSDVMREVWDRRFEPNYFVEKISMDDNPWIAKEEIDEYVKDLTPEEERAYRHGDIVHFAGMVFDKYWTEDHIIPQLAPKDLQGQAVVVSIDPGMKNTGLSWIAYDDDNVATLFDSAKLMDQTIDQIADFIRQKNAKWKIQEPEYYVIDPSARNRTQVNAEAIEAEFANYGIYTVHGQNDVEAGILQLQRRMHANQFFATENNIEFFDEVDKYRLDPKVKDKFAVIKYNDHILDSVRYSIMSRPWIGSVKLKKRGFTPRSPDEVGPWHPSPKQSRPHPLGAMV